MLDLRAALSIERAEHHSMDMLGIPRPCSTFCRKSKFLERVEQHTVKIWLYTGVCYFDCRYASGYVQSPPLSDVTDHGFVIITAANSGECIGRSAVPWDILQKRFCSRVYTS